MDFMQYIKPELLILIPVMILLGALLKKSKCADKYIPLIIGGVSILLCALWVLSTAAPHGLPDVSAALFTALTQGILVAGASVYANQIYKQSKK